MSTSHAAAPRSSLSRFTIRDLLWAMLFLAVCLGWWRTSRRAAVMEHNFRVLEGAFRPGELVYDGSGRIREMPRWSPASQGPSF